MGEDKEKAFYLDQQDFFGQFLLNPDIRDEADFSHLDKNLSITRLASRWKEPEQARHILRSLHVLNNKRYFHSVLVEENTDESKKETFYVYQCPICDSQAVLDEEQEEGVECCNQKIEPDVVEQEVPVKKKVIRNRSIFPRSYHSLKAKFYAFTTTSMARDGHLMKSATTTNFNESQSIEDRTKVRNNPFSFVKKNKYQE